MNHQPEVQLRKCIKCGNRHIDENCATKISVISWNHPAHEVFLVGDWTKWQIRQPMIKHPDGTFDLEVNLKVGSYQYKYIVDGKWCYDMDKPTVPDGCGSFNNYLQVEPLTIYIEPIEPQSCKKSECTVVKLISNLVGDEVKVLGSWDNWTREIHMQRTHNPLTNSDQSTTGLELHVGGRYQFKFNVDGKYVVDETYPAVLNPFGTYNNVLIVLSSPSTHQHHHHTPNSAKTSSFIESKEWSWQKLTVTDFPFHNIYGHTISSVGSELYLFGGIAKSNPRNDIIKINTQTRQCVIDEIVQCEPRAFHYAIVYGNKIIIYGGLNTKKTLTDYYSYNTSTAEANPSTDANKGNAIKGSPPSDREKGSCVLYKELLVFFGGYYLSPDLEWQTFFNDIAVLNLQKMTWEEAQKVQGQLPLGRFSHTADVYNDHMYIFGGEYDSRENKNLNDVWRLNLAKDLKWEQVHVTGTAPAPRHGHSANLIQKFLVIFGGQGDEGVYLNDVVILHLGNHEWIYPTITGDIPKGRYYHAASVVNGDQIMIFGGKTKEGRKNENIYVLKPKQLQTVLEF